MPTIPKVIAGLFFAAFAYFCGDLLKPVLPERTPVGLLSPVLAAIGFLAGWRVSGRNAGLGLRAAFGYGLTSVVVTAFWGDFAFAGYKMLQYSLDRRFRGPIEALQAMIRFFIEYAATAAFPTLLVTMAVGGLFGGWLVEWAARRWN